jgi:very-short-patch-repair endonuclease
VLQDPGMPSPPPETVVRLHGGLATSAQLVAGGASGRHVRAAVETGSLLRVRRGFYAVPDAPAAGATAVAAGGRLAGLSAADSFGLWGGWGSPLHLSVRGHAGHVGGRTLPSTRGVRLVDGRRAIVHWNDDRRDTEWCWRVSLDRCLRQVLRWHDAETAVAVVDTALTAGLLAEASVASLCDGPTAVLAGELARCAPGAQSGVESIARQRLERAGLMLRRQPEIPGVGHVDLGVTGTRVYVEVDGYEFHRSAEQFAEDRRRDAEARSRGYVPLRFTAVQVRDGWPWVERMILAAVAQFGRT